MERLFSTQGHKGHNQHGGSACSYQPPQHQDFSYCTLPTACWCTVDQVAAAQNPRLHQALCLHPDRQAASALLTALPLFSSSSARSAPGRFALGRFAAHSSLSHRHAFRCLCVQDSVYASGDTLKQQYQAANVDNFCPTECLMLTAIQFRVVTSLQPSQSHSGQCTNGHIDWCVPASRRGHA